MKRAHCSLLLRFVLVVIGLGILGLGVFTIFFNNNCEPVQLPYGLTITNDLHYTFISWFRRLPQECEATYLLRYTINGVEYEVRTSNQYYPLVRLRACSSLTARLWVIDESGEESRNYLVESYTEEITSLGPIQNLEICVCGETDALLSWDSPINAHECGYFNYVVTAQNGDYIQEILCTDFATCTMTLTSFCPYTNVTIRESTGIGEETLVTYDC